ncbi:hypothetical protein ACHAWO_002886 [Cyclotella atomus]|uniref:Uncharacterized protein n=1 Tax=Cyclotella atomus TaxID=382360 RepID=A0ABD3QHL9_9STRA
MAFRASRREFSMPARRSLAVGLSRSAVSPGWSSRPFTTAGGNGMKPYNPVAKENINELLIQDTCISTRVVLTPATI